MTGMEQNEYLQQLKTEKENVDVSFRHASRLLTEEIDRVEKGSKYTTVHNDKKVKLTEKVLIPVTEHPKFNFVGKLLGPQGNSLKRLQAETGTKMSILGKGSVRSKKAVANKEEVKEGDPRYAHLNDELHVFVEVFAAPMEAHSRMAHALAELRKFLVPDYNDEIRQQQLQELMHINGDERPPVPVPGPGAPERGRGRGRGLGPPRGRGAPLLATPPVRGAPAARGLARGAPALRARGGRGALGGRGVPPPSIPRAPAYEETYYETAYEDTAYSYAEPGYEGNTDYYEYSASANTAYDDGYGDAYGAEAWGNGHSYGKAPPARPAARSHPYSAASGRGRY